MLAPNYRGYPLSNYSKVKPMQIKIFKELLPHKLKTHRYMSDLEEYDYLAQIFTQLGYTIPEKCRTPADMNCVITHFTMNVRGKIVDTALTLEILKLDFVDKTQAIQRLTQLLEPIGMTVISVSPQKNKAPAE